jgi:hypothetical protein
LRVYYPFSTFFQFSGYRLGLLARYVYFIGSYVLPLLGPSPKEFRIKPSSYMGDDYTPIEMSLVLDSSGSHVVRFTVEPMDPETGAPADPSTWVDSLHDLARKGSIKDFDISWAKICMSTLTEENPECIAMCKSQHHSQFSVGTFPDGYLVRLKFN